MSTTKIDVSKEDDLNSYKVCTDNPPVRGILYATIPEEFRSSPTEEGLLKLTSNPEEYYQKHAGFYGILKSWLEENPMPLPSNEETKLSSDEAQEICLYDLLHFMRTGGKFADQFLNYVLQEPEVTLTLEEDSGIILEPKARKVFEDLITVHSKLDD